MEHIALAVEDGIATIRFDRPDSLNAFTDTMEVELIEAFDAVDADPEVRVVVLTGTYRDLGDLHLPATGAGAVWASRTRAVAGMKLPSTRV